MSICPALLLLYIEFLFISLYQEPSHSSFISFETSTAEQNPRCGVTIYVEYNTGHIRRTLVADYIKWFFSLSIILLSIIEKTLFVRFIYFGKCWRYLADIPFSGESLFRKKRRNIRFRYKLIMSLCNILALRHLFSHFGVNIMPNVVS